MIMDKYQQRLICKLESGKIYKYSTTITDKGNLQHVTKSTSTEYVFFSFSGWMIDILSTITFCVCVFA